jgi:hypothetical protein
LKEEYINKDLFEIECDNIVDALSYLSEAEFVEGLLFLAIIFILLQIIC